MSMIKGFKLTNGTDIIASIVSDNEKVYELGDAMFVSLQQAQDGFVLDFQPLTYFKDKLTSSPGTDFELSKSIVLFSYEANDKVISEYLKHVGRIQQINPSGLIV